MTSQRNGNRKESNYDVSSLPGGLRLPSPGLPMALPSPTGLPHSRIFPTPASRNHLLMASGSRGPPVDPSGAQLGTPVPGSPQLGPLMSAGQMAQRVIGSSHHGAHVGAQLVPGHPAPMPHQHPSAVLQQQLQQQQVSGECCLFYFFSFGSEVRLFGTFGSFGRHFWLFGRHFWFGWKTLSVHSEYTFGFISNVKAFGHLSITYVEISKADCSCHRCIFSSFSFGCKASWATLMYLPSEV
jgi:hypothetical protein